MTPAEKLERDSHPLGDPIFNPPRKEPPMKTVKCECCNGSGTHQMPRDLITALYQDGRLSLDDAHRLVDCLRQGIHDLSQSKLSVVVVPVGAEFIPFASYRGSCGAPTSSFARVEITR